MANLEFYDKHNMVAYLQKFEGSEGFHQIIDFLNASHIQYALQTSLRRHLKLEDNGGVTTLPNSEIFEQLALMGTPSTLQPPNTQPTPDAEEAVLMPHESPLHSVHLLGRDEGSLSLNELTGLCTSLSNKVQSLETELKETKQTYNSALTQLIRRVKKLEHIMKASKSRRRARVVESDDEEDLEDPSKQGRNEGRNDDTQIYDLPAEQLGVFSAATTLEDAAKRRSVETAQTYTRRIRSVSTGSGRVSTASRIVSTASKLGSTAGVKAKDKGKTIMQESEPLKKVKKRVQLYEWEEVDDEPTQAQQIDWSDPAVEKKGSRKKSLARKRAGEKQSDESTKRQKIEDDVEKEELKAYLDLVLREEFAMADGSFKNYKIFSEMLDDFDRQDVLDLHRLVKVRYMTSSLKGYDLMLWGDLKILFEPDEEDEV
ncbi:hypothetical protein Tco_0038193 [Tanacetum coccineum]